MRILPFTLAGLLLIISCDDDNAGGDGDTAGAIFLGRPPVVINEVYSANADLKDEFGGDPGWVELYNPANVAVNLSGYYLTNNSLRKLWAFGDVEVGPRSYAVVFLSGRDRPNLDPPRDSIGLLAGSIGAWAWADSSNSPIAGRSSSYHEYSRNPANISGTLNARDNSGGLGWTSATVFLKFTGWESTDVIDVSGANQLLLRGFVSKNAQLELRLPQSGIGDWQGWPAVVTGTGDADGLYVIELPSSAGNEDVFKNIYGIRFANTPDFRGTIEFSFNSIVARKRGSDIHASFELSDRGGRLFLLDGDGYIRDSVAYPAATLGLSYAKNADNGKWALSKPPTPYADNSSETYTGQVQPPSSAGIPNSGYHEGPLAFTLPGVGNDVFIACDTTGRAPTADSRLRSGVSISLTKTTVMRCAQFKAGAYPSEPVMRTYIIGERQPSLPVVSIAVDPYEMFDQTDGLYSMGPNASPTFPHQGANFWRDTELPVQLDFFEGGARYAWNSKAGLRIFGNWSKGNPKKSVLITFREIYGQNNLRYALFPSHPQLTRFKHFILRNNGNNFDQDYIRDMLMTSLTEGLGVDYQKGRAAIVYYNGQYFGIHNLRERANGDYFETNYGIDEDYIDLVKAGGEVSSGSDADYQNNIHNWVSSVTLTDENLRILEERMDVDNFTYNHIARIYYNDRDWPGNNMKRWRVNTPPSKWKWLMYDTDHGWGSHGQWEQPNLGALAFATRADGPDWPNPPHSTLVLRKLLENEGYKNSFINRFSLLIATYYAPSRVGARIDALMAPIESEVPRDQQRWNHDAGKMSDQLSVIRRFGSTRPLEMQREIETFFKLDAGSSVNFTVSANGGGNVLVDNLQVLGGTATFKAYPSVPVTLKAVPNPGVAFNGWSDGDTNAERVVDVSGPLTLEARFGSAF